MKAYKCKSQKIATMRNVLEIQSQNIPLQWKPGLQ